MNREDPSAPVPPSNRDGDKQAEEDLWQRHKAERGVWTKLMLAALARGGKDCHSRDNGITIGRFEQNSQSRLLAVREHLNKGIYQPRPVKRVWIEKPDSADKRPLGIPTVTDRVVQAALRMGIEPIFENRFAKHSYGFRPGRGCEDALRQVEELLQAGRTHVVEMDIKGYFDAIPHGRLMALVREPIAAGRVLGLIEGFLKKGAMEDIESAKAMQEMPEDESQGTPQGGVISPLLANIYLDPLDWLMERCGFKMMRYVDDTVVLCSTEEEAKAALAKLREWMAEAGLTLHPDKIRTVDMNLAASHFDFLGYRFKRNRRGKMMRLVRPKSLCKLRGLEGRGGGKDHHRWPNRYFKKLGLFCLLDARETKFASLRKGANC